MKNYHVLSSGAPNNTSTARSTQSARKTTTNFRHVCRRRLERLVGWRLPSGVLIVEVFLEGRCWDEQASARKEVPLIVCAIIDMVPRQACKLLFMLLLAHLLDDVCAECSTEAEEERRNEERTYEPKQDVEGDIIPPTVSLRRVGQDESDPNKPTIPQPKNMGTAKTKATATMR